MSIIHKASSLYVWLICYIDVPSKIKGQNASIL